MPFLILKSIVMLPPNLLSFDFIISNILPNGAISGQWAALIFTIKSRLWIIFCVISEECVLTLSITIIWGFLMFVKLHLIIPDSGVKKNFKNLEFIVLIKITEDHSLAFQKSKIRIALLFSISLIIWQLCSTGSHKYCFLINPSKLESSQFMTSLPQAIKEVS